MKSLNNLKTEFINKSQQNDSVLEDLESKIRIEKNKNLELLEQFEMVQGQLTKVKTDKNLALEKFDQEINELISENRELKLKVTKSETESGTIRQDLINLKIQLGRKTGNDLGQS